MKDIQKLKIWSTLKEEGFELKDIKVNGILYGRGAILRKSFKQDFPFIEIKPLTNGRWKLTSDHFNSASSWEVTPFELGKLLPDRLKKFREITNG